MEQSPIKLYLVNGFLGAGKTTFMLSLIQVLQDRRLGVLMNEFGNVGIDGTLVKKGDIKLVEINNGSVFCACIKDGFVSTLKAFSQQPIDCLLIESSGMADPAGMVKILDGLAPYLDRPYQYIGSICLVDCTTFLDYADILMPIQNQAASADFIILNKTDLVNESQLNEVHKYISFLNEDAPVYNTIYAQVPADVLLSRIKSRGYEGEGTNTPYNRPGSYTLLTEAKLSKEQTLKFCALLTGKILRFKGFLRNDSGGFWHVQGVANQYSVEPAEFGNNQPPDTGKIVLIDFGEDFAADVQQVWAACSSEQAQLKAG